LRREVLGTSSSLSAPRKRGRPRKNPEVDVLRREVLRPSSPSLLNASPGPSLPRTMIQEQGSGSGTPISGVRAPARGRPRKRTEELASDTAEPASSSPPHQGRTKRQNMSPRLHSPAALEKSRSSVQELAEIGGNDETTDLHLASHPASPAPATPSPGRGRARSELQDKPAVPRTPQSDALAAVQRNLAKEDQTGLPAREPQPANEGSTDAATEETQVGGNLRPELLDGVRARRSRCGHDGFGCERVSCSLCGASAENV